MSAPLRALFLSEAHLYQRAAGHAIRGPATVERAIATGLRDVPDVDARFVHVPPTSAVERALARHVPLLGRADLDLQALRWLLVHSRAARRVLRKELARAPVDAVHVNSHSIAFLMQREMRRVPFFLSVDAVAWEWRRMSSGRRHSRTLFAPAAALERRALRSAAIVLAWTEWARAGVEATAPGANVVELSPGVDLERFHPVRDTGEPSRPSRVLFVGARFREKGGHDLIAALDGLLGDEVELDIVTTTPLPPSKGVRVHALTHDDERLVELFQRADLFCLPTYAEAMGFVIQEAMACGVAVVTTNVAALPEVIGDGSAGVVVDPGDRSALRAAIESLLADDARRAELGAAGRARCERLYDARKQTAELVRLMREAAR